MSIMATPTYIGPQGTQETIMDTGEVGKCQRTWEIETETPCWTQEDPTRYRKTPACV